MEVSNKDSGRYKMPADAAGDEEAERPWKCANWRTGLELVQLFLSGCVGSRGRRLSLELGLEVALALVAANWTPGLAVGLAAGWG